MSDSGEENKLERETTNQSHKAVQDPTGLIRLPRSSVRVEDPEEEVFLLYTSLSSRQPHDISTVSSFPGLGSVDSKHDTITVRFSLPPRPGSKSTGSAQKTKPKRRRQRQRQDRKQTTTGRLGGGMTWKQMPCESVPSALEDSDTSHVSRKSKQDKRAKLHTSPNDWKRSGSFAHLVDDERTLEIELMQDKTALRSKKGDTGSVLWRVSVVVGQALLNDFSSESPQPLFDPEKLRSCNVLELGAGTGLLSLVFAPWVRHYTATDLDYLVPLIRKNVATNLSVIQQVFKDSKGQSVPSPYPSPSSSSSKISRRATGFRGGEDNIDIRDESFFNNIQATVEPLDWLELQRQRALPHTRRGSGVPNTNTTNRNTAFRLAHADPPDLIVIADCVYNPALIPALLSAVEYYAEPRRTCVLVAVELRSSDVVREFLESWIGLGGWEIWRVGTTESESRDADGESDLDDGDNSGKGHDENWLGVDFAVWVGWKP